MRILSNEELMHTGPDAMREYCKSLGESLREALDECVDLGNMRHGLEAQNAKLCEALARCLLSKPLSEVEWVEYSKLLGADDDKPS